MKTVLFSSSAGDVNANMAFINKYDATTAPGVGNDSSQGYEVGSEWINVSSGVAYQCVDTTVGAAVWVVTSSDETVPGQVKAPNASSATGAGSAASLTGGSGGSTSGAGGASNVVGGAATGGNSAGGAAGATGGAGHGSSAGGVASLTGGAAGATGAGGAAQVTGGAGGATSGAGGTANLTGGAATAGNSNGGDAVIGGGAKQGSGIDGNAVVRSVFMVHQGAPAAKTVSATLTAAEVLAGIITVNQGGAASSAQQLPLATDFDLALPNSIAGDAFDFSMINISTVAAESASITTNTGWTLVGDMDVAANSAATTKSAGRFRARKTATGAWTLYRLA